MEYTLFNSDVLDDTRDARAGMYLHGNRQQTSPNYQQEVVRLTNKLVLQQKHVKRRPLQHQQPRTMVRLRSIWEFI